MMRHHSFRAIFSLSLNIMLSPVLPVCYVELRAYALLGIVVISVSYFENNYTDLNDHFTLNSAFFSPVCLEVWSLAFGAWLLLNFYWMSGNIKPKRTASRGFLAIVRLFCLSYRQPVQRMFKSMLSCSVSEILQVCCWEERPHPYSTQFWGVPLRLDYCCWGSEERRP